jgi:hypothetical protein
MRDDEEDEDDDDIDEWCFWHPVPTIAAENSPAAASRMARFMGVTSEFPTTYIDVSRRAAA